MYGFDSDQTDTDQTGVEGTDEKQKFEPGYEVDEGRRIFRQRLRFDAHDGTAKITFRGDLDATQITIDGTPGRLSAYAEVSTEAGVITEVVLAGVPTGKRVPLNGHRLGQVNGLHVYLISVEAYRAVSVQSVPTI